ncbi:MAG TPA: hypothetical protein VIK72_14430 [Clostridiaceae bacterium]
MNLIYKMAARRWDKLFKQQVKYIKAFLYEDLVEEYKNLDLNLEGEKTLSAQNTESEVLAAQVISYLLGEDIEGEALRSKDVVFKAVFEKTKNEIKQYAQNKMKNDLEVRKLIVYTLRMGMTIQAGILGNKYLVTPEYKRKSSLLLKYGHEFPEEVNENMYMEIYKNFIKNSEKSKNK